MNCENCKHWGLEDRYSYLYKRTPQLRKCMKVPLLDDCYEWAEDEDGELSNKLKDESILAFAQDASSYRADLITRPNFYCNMWEQK